MNKRNFSSLTRTETLDSVEGTTFDLIVLGGGVTGAGIALDASSRGMNVLLLEKDDFASGTSNKSTKLIHGGLRYLKQFEFGLVKETGTERAIVHKLAPHLAVPEKMLLPFVTDGTYGSFSTSVGLKIYDLLAGVLKKDRRKMLSKSQTLNAEPLLNSATVEGGGLYSEYRTDDARLTIEILKTAHRYEAVLLNYAEVKSFVINFGEVKGVVFQDHISGKEMMAKSQVVVVAAGPWLDTILKKRDTMLPNKLRLTKGVHIVVSHDKFPIKQPVYFDTPDGRMVFAIPRGRCTYIGTTDTEYHGRLDRVVATEGDCEYLLNALRRVFPDVILSIADVESNWAGLRPLIEQVGKSPSELSRKDEIYEMPDGIIAIAGGKLTGYRRMAQRVTDLVQKRLDLPYRVKSRTAMIALSRDPFTNFKVVEKTISHYEKLMKKWRIPKLWGQYLVMTYGSEASVIWKYFQTQKPLTEQGLVLAELWYVIHFEMAQTPADYFVRRGGRLYFDIASVLQWKSLVMDTFKSAFQWDEDRVDRELTILNRYIQDATTYYKNEMPEE